MHSLVQYFQQGGFMMYPLILCCVVAIGIILERAYTFWKASRIDPDGLLEDIKASYKPGQAQAALQTLPTDRSPFARIFARGLKNADRSPEAIEAAMAQEAANEVPPLENYLLGLKTIITIAPLLGLLGTIAGMIYSFQRVATEGLSSPTKVLTGVSEALISTATGIALAAIAVIFYNYFGNLIKRFIEDMEYYGTELTNFLTGRVA